MAVAPTGSGKTLAAFLWCLNRLLFLILTSAARARLASADTVMGAGEVTWVGVELRSRPWALGTG